MDKSFTKKIFYEEPYRQTCTAAIIDVRTVNGEEWLLPDQTLFYPGGGGQAADRGTINDVNLQKIYADKSGIWHLPAKKIGIAAGEKVELQLNWDWRFYQMQQHTGQHLLSHVLYKAGLHTVSVHLGEAYTLIEVEGPVPDKSLIEKIEGRANELIRAALPVKTHWTDKEGVKKFPLRRKAGDHEVLRVVEIDEHDYSACAGTHLANTSQIGLIKWVGLEKIRKRVRLKFLIGQKAYSYFDQLHKMQNSLKEILHNDFSQFEQRIREMQDKIAQQKKQLNFFRKKYLENYIQELSRGKSPVVLKLQNELKDDATKITRRLAADYNLAAFIFYGERFFMALPAGSGRDAREFLNLENEHYELKGGGTADFVQGKLKQGSENNIKRAFLRFLNPE